DKQHPVNYTTDKQHPVNYTTDKQHPVNYTTDKQHPVNYTTHKQHPVNNSTYNQDPINNTLLFTNLRLNIITPLISILIKVKEIKNKNIKKILIKTNNTLLNISKISLINNTITNIRIIKDESTDKDIFYILQFLKELEIIPFTSKSSEEEVFIIRNVKIISYFSLSLYSKVIFKSKNIYILFKKDSLRIEIPISIGVNDSGLEGFSDSSRLEGVNDSGIEGVSDKGSGLEGVNLSNYNYKGVNISTNKQHPFNTNNNTTYHPFNTNNTTQHPFNTTINTLNVSLVILKDTNGLIITPVITGSIDNEFYRILTRNILEIIEITLNIIDCILIKGEKTTFNFNILPLVCVRLYCIIGNSVIELGVLDSSIEIKGVSGNSFIKEEGGVNDTGVDKDRGNGLEGVKDKDSNYKEEWGVNDKDSNIKGVRDKSTNIKGVSDKSNKDSYKDSNKGSYKNNKELLDALLKGINNNTNNYNNNTTNNTSNTTPLDVISTDFIYQQFIENYPLIDILTPFLLLTINIKEISLKPIKYYCNIKGVSDYKDIKGVNDKSNILENIKGVNDKDNILENLKGVNDKDIEEGLNYKDIRGVSDKYNQEEGVSDRDIDEGVNDKSNDYKDNQEEGVSDRDIDEGVNYKSNDYKYNQEEGVNDRDIKGVNNKSNEHNPFILITNSTIIILKGTLGINTHISIRKVNTLQSLTILLLIKQSFITPDFSYGIPTLLTPFNIYLKIYNIEYTTVEYDSVVKGVNNSTYNYNPVNNSSSKQQGVNNSTYNYNPVNNSSSKQQGVNNSTYNYNPVNNS
ncbi:hypothetical protein CWI38_2477p0010, partial [Hamiltosporidium tvaerminnensis]